MGTQEFYANVDLKGNELKNVVVDVVTELPATVTAGRIVSKGGDFYVGNGTKWVMMADDDVVQALKTAVGDSKGGLVKDVNALKEAVGTDESGNNLTTRVSTLETTVGGESSGLVKKVTDNTTSINTNAKDISTLKTSVSAVENKATTNADNITTLQGDLKTAQDDIVKLKTSVGTSDDTASATGTVYARIAQNVADIGTLKTAVGDSTSGLTKKVADLESGKVDKVTGKGLSTNDYTTDEKNKLAGIAEGAQVNVIESVKVDGTALAIDSKAVNIDLSGYAKKSEVGGAYVFKGSVADSTKLPTGYGTEQIGWVYNVEASFSDGESGNVKTYPAGTNVAWTGSKWDPLGGQTDFTVFALKTEVKTALDGKQDTLNDTQKNAVNSGITSTRVSAYDGYADSISNNTAAITSVKETADAAVVANAAITGATKCKVTYDSKGLVTAGADLTASDIPALDTSKITTGTFVADRIPVKLVSMSATLSTSASVEVRSGLATVYLAQVLYNGKVIFVDTSISGGTVTLAAASEALNVTVNMVGILSS